MGQTDRGWTAVVRGLGRMAILMALLGFLTSLLERVWWIGDLTAHLRPFFALLLGIGSWALWLRDRIWWSLACGMVAFSFPLFLIPGHRPLRLAEPGDVSHSV